MLRFALAFCFRISRQLAKYTIRCKIYFSFIYNGTELLDNGRIKANQNIACVVDIKILHFKEIFLNSFSRSSLIFGFNKRSQFNLCWIIRNTAFFCSIIENNKLHEKSKRLKHMCYFNNRYKYHHLHAVCFNFMFKFV